MKTLKSVTELSKEMGITRQRLHQILNYYRIKPQRVGRQYIIDEKTENLIRSTR